MAECNGHNHKFPDLINNKLIICIKWAYLVSEGGYSYQQVQHRGQVHTTF